MISLLPPQSNFPALQNAITGFATSNDRRFELLETQPSGRVVPPLSTNNLDPTSIPASEDFPQYDKNNDRRNAFSGEDDQVSKGLQPPSTSVEPPKLLPTYNAEFRRREEARLQQLGLPIQQSANQFVANQRKSVSQFSSQSKAAPVPQKVRQQQQQQPVAQQFVFTAPSTSRPAPTTARTVPTTPRPAPTTARTAPPTTTRYTPVISRVTASPTGNRNAYQKQPTPLDLDKNYKAFEHILQFNKKGSFNDYDFSRLFTKKPSADSSSGIQRQQQSFTTSQRVTTTTTRPTTARQQQQNFNQRQPQQQEQQPSIAAQRFAPSAFVAPPASAQSSVRVTAAPKTAATTKQPLTTRRIIVTTAPTTPQPPRALQQSSFNQPSGFVINKFQQKANQFSSPQNLVPTSSQGASGNVKEPHRDLLPPFDTLRNYDDITTQGPKAYYDWKLPDRGLLPPKHDNETESHTKTKKSISDEGNFDNDFQGSETRRSSPGRAGPKIQYRDLQRQLSIPSIQLPIESDGRVGYEKLDAVNSFQVKIPYRKDKTDRYYYLEHAHCNPECHPYFFKPGRCEPCIKLQ